jgi:hypothetical protein
VKTKLVEPRAGHETEVCTASGHEVERCDLAGDLDGVQCLCVESRGPEAHALGGAGDREQRRDRRLEEQIVVDGDDVEPGALGPTGETNVLLGGLVRLQA